MVKYCEFGFFRKSNAINSRLKAKTAMGLWKERKSQIMSNTYTRAEKALNAALLFGAQAVGKLFRKEYRAMGRRGSNYSEKMLRRIIRKNRNTEFGRKYHFEDIKSPEDFQKAIPLTTYEDFRPYIDRMVEDGEQNLITSSRISYFSLTSGTVNKEKLIPTKALMINFKAVMMMADDLYEAMKRKGLKRRYGKGFLTIEISISDKKDKAGNKKKIGYVSSYSVDKLKALFPVLVAQPKEAVQSDEIGDMKYIKSRYALQDPDIVYVAGTFMTVLVDYVNYILQNKDMLIHDIETGTIDPSINISQRLRNKLEKELSPDPVRAAELREILDHPDDGPLLNRIWKDLCMVGALGTGDFLPFTETMRLFCDDTVSFTFGQYSATENLFGVVMGLEEQKFLLLPDGAFFEFIPVDEDGYGSEEINDEGKTELTMRPRLMDELEVGKLYELVFTNSTGLYRYMIRDVVRVVGYEGNIPYIEFAYRANHVCNICNVHLTGEHLKYAVKYLEEYTGVHVEDYSMYSNLATQPPRAELFYETMQPVPPEKTEGLREFLDTKLRESSWSYDLYRGSENVGLIGVFRVEPGTYSEYRERQIREGRQRNQLKALRIIDNEKRYDYFRSHIVHDNDKNAE